MAMSEKREPGLTAFAGTVVQRSSNGSGIVQFDLPSSDKVGVFNLDVIHAPAVDRIVKVGSHVEGLAVPFGDNYKILRIDPK